MTQARVSKFPPDKRIFIFDRATRLELLEILGSDDRAERTVDAIEGRVAVLVRVLKPAELEQKRDDDELRRAFRKIQRANLRLVRELLAIEPLWRNRDRAVTDAAYGLLTIRDFAATRLRRRPGRPRAVARETFCESVAWTLFFERYPVKTTQGGLYDRILVIALNAAGERSDQDLSHVIRSAVSTLRESMKESKKIVTAKIMRLSRAEFPH